MRKIFMALAAVAAMVGCSKENAPIDAIEKDSFTMNASIVLDETRVTVEGDKFTDFKWAQGDVVTLSSKAGAAARVVAEDGGDTGVRFVGEGSAVADADTDTYYAIYPATTITDGVANVELASQSGGDKDSAVLVAKADGNKGATINMAFKPANALLHVAVSGVSSLSMAEFVAFDGAKLPQGFDYLFESGATQYYGGVAAYTIDTPSVDGFFFSLPADLNLENGYVVRLTDASGNVCSKAYNGKTFAKATTTRVDIEWSTPSVTLGVPMTSYSYYDAGDSATANSCANNVIYFTQSSTYANLQNAMVSEAGFIVDGRTYTATLDTATKSFSMGNVTVSSWGAKSVEAFVKTKDGRTIKSAPATVHITGLPYYADWRAADYSDWTYKKISDKGNYLTVDNGALGCIISPAFHIPANINTIPSVAACTGATGLGGYNKCYMYAGTKNSSSSESGSYVTIPYVAADANDPSTPLQALDGKVTLSSSTPCCVITAKDFRLFCDTNIYQAKIEYAQ